MTYGEEHGETTYRSEDGRTVRVDLGTTEFYDQADRVFYAWNANLHTPHGRFARLFSYERYRGKPVLEVGCGMGCMAMNWARQGARIVAIDLNPTAVRQTRQRFQVFQLPGAFMETDGRHLPFPDESFDYAYSWGVLHHSPAIQQSVRELYRVLKPGGECGVMLYNRDSFLYRYGIEYLEGWLHLERRFLDPLELASRYGDGARAEGNPHTWPVTKREAFELFGPFRDVRVKVLGTDLVGLFDRVFPKLGSWMPLPILKAYARRWGWSLWIMGSKRP
jgi:SAM-dependent methyltransferase